MKPKHILFLLTAICFFLIAGENMLAQTNTIDSLKLSLKKTKQDTDKVNTLINLGRALMKKDDHTGSFIYSREALNLSQKINFERGISRSCYVLGICFKETGQYDSAITYHLKALKIREKLNNKKTIADSYNSLGDIYNNKGNYKEALNYFLLSLKNYAEAGEKGGMAWANCNIGVVLTNQNNLPEAISKYKEAIRLAEKINDLNSIAWFNNNLGNAYITLKEYDKALECFQTSLKNELQSSVRGRSLAFTYNSIGSVYFNSEKYDAAILNYEKALSIRREVKDRNGIAWSLTDIGAVYLKKKNYGEAISKYSQALQIALAIGQKERIRDCYSSLSESHFLTGSYKKAYEYHLKFTQVKDSLLNEELHGQITDIKAKYESEQKDTEIKLLNKDKEKQAAITKAESEEKKVIIWSVAGVLFLAIVFSLVIFNRWRVSQKQKVIIEHQKIIVEEKHKEITDSINYAERIQRSFLATEELLLDNLQDHLVFFRPKDVVSGDFYWASKLANGNFLLATADSTGHGVPGAIMSILNISSLEKAIDHDLLEPAEILNHTRKTIIDRLKKDGSAEGGKDGMDCSLICLDLKNNKLTYSAANNPVWIVRGNEILEFTPDKMPVGKHDKDTIPFSQHTIDLKKDDIIYTLTDGLPDQFGGEKGKKFKYKQLKEILLHVNSKPLKEQAQIIDQTFTTWKGDLEQVDDVLIIGIKI